MFEQEDRVTVSQHGVTSGIALEGSIGTVVSFSRNGNPRVRWDGRKTADSLHWIHLRHLAEDDVPDGFEEIRIRAFYDGKNLIVPHQKIIWLDGMRDVRPGFTPADSTA